MIVMRLKYPPPIRMIKIRAAFCIFFFVMSAVNAWAQNDVGKIVDLSVDNKRLVEILYELSSAHQIKFFFEPNDLPYYPLNENFESEAIYAIIKKLTDGTKLIVVPHEDKGLCVIQRPKANAEYVESLIKKWEDGTYNYPFDERAEVLNYTFGDQSQNQGIAKLTISLIDETLNESIIGAVVSNKDLTVNGVSGADGNIMLEILKGEHTLLVNYIGYQSIELNLGLYEDAKIDLSMSFQSFLFDEIEVVASGIDQKLKSSAVGTEVIDIQKLESIPQVLGEVDVIKSLEILPGVTTAGELSSGFNVRGGNIDESLVLLNDGIIFNPTHIVGFISAFNADALDNATLYKSYVDPAYGGRGSAVLDLKSDASNVKEFKGKGGLGTSMAKLYLEGPITEKIDFHISGRGSFNDYLLSLVANTELRNSNARFFDFNGGLTYRINDKHKVNFNNYYSSDFFEYNDEFGFKWSNSHLGLQWKSNWTEKTYSSLSLNYGTYDTDNFTLGTPEASSFKSGLYYYKVLASVNRQIGENGFLKVGAEFIEYHNRSDRLDPSAGSTITAKSIQRKAGISLSPFLTFNQKIGERITFETGIRWSNYFTTGPGQIFSYEGDEKEERTIVTQEELNGFDTEGTHRVIEPRFSINYNFTENWSVKAAYNRMSQNIFQLSTTNTALPSDLWIFTDRHIQPLIVDQYSIGLFTANKRKHFSVEVDVFAKRFDNLYELRNFSQVVLNEHIETELIDAEGKSYGFEFLFRKQKGKWTGNVAYTYSRALRKTTDEFKSINNNEFFASDFDIPHQLNILASYQGLPVVFFNFAYVFKSGKPTTIPSGTIIQDDILVPLYARRNQERIPYYSRFDFSITMDLRKTKQKGFRNSFTLGVYNLLGRNNANNVFFRRSAKGNIVPFQFAVVGSAIPNLTWNFVF